MSPPRVKVKVYGVISLSKRAYLAIQITGGLIVLIAIVAALLWQRPAPIPGHPLPPFVSTFALILDLFPWIGLLGLILTGLETHIVLGKFRREEERQRNLTEASRERERPEEKAPEEKAPAAHAPGSPSNPNPS